MNKRDLDTLIRWLNRNQTQVRVNEQLLFEEALGVKNDWRIRQCIHAYCEQGIVPDFVTAFVRTKLYPEIVIGGTNVQEALCSNRS